jgi:cytoskeleton protein RodZ
MPDIGSTLRDARMRQRIDIADMEVRTKIRAKYLRALENEEWDLLPGPTYVKSFLRTYGEVLGLDPRLLVEEYKLRHEPLETTELQPIRPPTGRERSRRSEPRPGIPRGAVIALVLLLIFGALFLIGQRSEDEAGTAGDPPAETTGGSEDAESAGGGDAGAGGEGERPRRRVVRLTVAPSAPVWICLVDAGGRRLIPGTEVGPGTNRSFRSRRFRMTIGNGNVRLRVDGRPFSPPQAAEPQGFEFTRGGRRTLTAAQRPTCAAS